MKSHRLLLRCLLLSVGFLSGQEGYIGEQNRDRGRDLGDGVVLVGVEREEEQESRFEELMKEAQLIFVEALIADKSTDTLEAAFYFDLLFEAMSDIEQLPFLDELQRLEFNRFLGSAIAFYEDDSQTLNKIETALTVSALRDELGRFTRRFPSSIGEVAELDFDGEGGIPITYNEHVARIIQFFTTQGRRNMQAWLNRIPRYRPIIEPILLDEEVPPELIYLALVESGLNPKARSWKHAVGPWQFISSTGRRYNLNRDWWMDERRDFEKSTRAAARYLKDLYAEFDDWYLAMAAYNTGESRVRRAIRVHQSRDFWKLFILPRQTRNYIPNIMAAFLIAQDPMKYGFTVVPEPVLEWDEVPVDRSLTFEILGQIAEANPDTFALFNAELRQRATPPSDAENPYMFHLPKGHKAAFERNYEAIASQVGPVMADVRIRSHRVRRGESLYSISKRYGVPIDKIARANNIRNKNRLRLGQRLEIPVASSVTARQAVIPSSRSHRKVIYTVKPGDTLSEIAERNDVGLSKVKSWNGILSGNGNIRVGQKMVIWVPLRRALKPLDLKAPAGTEKHVYVVRPGDTLGQIAEDYSVGLSKLRSWNDIQRGLGHIRVGQKLVIFRSKG